MRLFYILVVEIRKGNRQEWLHYQIKEWLLAPQFPCSHIYVYLSMVLSALDHSHRLQPKCIMYMMLFYYGIEYARIEF